MPRPAAIRPRDLLKLATFPTHPFDAMHRVDTSGLVPARHLLTGHPNDEHVTAYYAVAPSILRALLDEWRNTLPPFPIHRYTFIDIGAGKGRAVLVASELHFRKAIGVELNAGLCAIARSNVAIWQEAHRDDRTAPRLCPIEIVEQDALDLRLPRTPSLLFLFHPFEEPVLTALLDRIEAQSSPRSGSLDLLYVNAECASVFDAHPAFTQLFKGSVPMSTSDHAADREAIANQKDYGSTGDEECAIYRFTGVGRGVAGRVKPRIPRRIEPKP